MSAPVQVQVPCVKGPCCRPSTSTEFPATHPSELVGIISVDEYQTSIARINASLQRPKWTFRVQTLGRVLMVLGLLILLVAGVKFLHMKYRHRQHHQQEHDNDSKEDKTAQGWTPAAGDYAKVGEGYMPVGGDYVEGAPTPVPVGTHASSTPVASASIAVQFSSLPLLSASASASLQVQPQNEQSEEEEEDDDDKPSWWGRRHGDDDDDNESEGHKHRMGRGRRHHGRHHGDRKHHDENQMQAASSASLADDSSQPDHKEEHKPKCHKCIRRLFHCGLTSLLVGFVLCRWIVGKKQHQLITRVVPAICAEHAYYTSSSRAIPVSWSLDEASVKYYNCKNNALKLVLDLHSTVPLASLNEKQLNAITPEGHQQMMSSTSAYVPLTTNEA